MAASTQIASARTQRRAKRPSRLSQDVATEVTERIVRGIFAPGEALPSEAILCNFFAVSRPVVREAIKVVESKKLVRIRQGEGTTVMAPEYWNLLDPDVLRISLETDRFPTLREDVIALRRDLEVEMVKRAASRLTEEDFAELETLLAVMDSSDDPAALHLADDNFHRVIQRASGNDVGRTIVFLLLSEIHTANQIGFGRTEYDETNQSHRRVYDFLRAGDAEGAGAAMYEHIATRWLFGGAAGQVVKHVAFPPMV